MKRYMHAVSFRKVFFLTAACFLLLMFSIVIGAHTRTKILIHKADISLARGLQSEQSYLNTTADTLAAKPEIVSAVKAQDAPAVLTALHPDKGTGTVALAVANMDGTVFTRTVRSLGKGDNAFVIGTLGRVLTQTGKPVSSVERSGIDPSQIIISAARFVYSGDQKIGALFATYLVNDTYAEQFATTYLPKGDDVLFYTHDLGIHGESISDTETQKMVAKFFYPTSDWIQGTHNHGIIQLHDGRYFAVINKTFPGLERSPGGILVLVPVYTYLHQVQLLAALITLAFCLYLLTAHRRHHKLLGNPHRRSIGFLIFLLVLCCILFVEDIPVPGVSRLGPSSPVLYNSVLQLSPQSKTFDRSYGISVGITVNTGPESINAVGLSMAYDPAAVEVQDISNDGSICTQIVDTQIDTSTGKITFSCLIAGGFSGTGSVGTLKMHPRVAGTFGLHFLEDTQVLANDGLGTNVLRLALPGSYTATSTSQSQLSLYSPSHPDSERWYNNPVIDFSWNGPATTTYAYSFDTQASSTNPMTNIVTGQKITVTAPRDGLYYFHLTPKTEGAGNRTSTYAVRIDTTPPNNVGIRTSATRIAVGDQVRLELSGDDEPSGMQKNFYLSIDWGLFLPVHQSVYIPFDSPGTKDLTVRAYDTAGNMVEQKTQIQVTGTIFQHIGALISSVASTAP